MVRLVVDPERPHPRQIRRIVEVLQGGGVIAYPTDTVYGLGCDMMQKRAVEKVYSIKGKDKKRSLSFICENLKDIASFAVVGDNAYRLMRRILPGPYTIILNASRRVPKVMLNQMATVGIRIPDHPVPLAIVAELGNPLVTSSIPTPPQLAYNDPDELEKRFSGALDGIIDSGIIYPEPSTIIDMTQDVPRLIRQGKGCIESIPDLVLIEDEDD